MAPFSHWHLTSVIYFATPSTPRMSTAVLTPSLNIFTSHQLPPHTNSQLRVNIVWYAPNTTSQQAALRICKRLHRWGGRDPSGSRHLLPSVAQANPSFAAKTINTGEPTMDQHHRPLCNGVSTRIRPDEPRLSAVDREERRAGGVP